MRRIVFAGKAIGVQPDTQRLGDVGGGEWQSMATATSGIELNEQRLIGAKNPISRGNIASQSVYGAELVVFAAAADTGDGHMGIAEVESIAFVTGDIEDCLIDIGAVGVEREDEVAATDNVVAGELVLIGIFAGSEAKVIRREHRRPKEHPNVRIEVDPLDEADQHLDTDRLLDATSWRSFGGKPAKQSGEMLCCTK